MMVSPAMLKIQIPGHYKAVGQRDLIFLEKTKFLEKHNGDRRH
jgi:hypothetical protein